MRFINRFISAALAVIFMQCSNSENLPNPDLEGHRGARGLYPENSIPGFIHALDLGVTTLEMDVVISADGKVVVSHEPFMSPEICILDDDSISPEQAEKEYNIYRMDYSRIMEFDCGSKPHPRFPEQKKIAVSKPLLKDVIDSAEAHAGESGRMLPWYNIETKCTPDGDGVHHPPPGEFTDRLMEVIREAGISDRCIIQSFDIRTLQHLHKEDAPVLLSLLIYNNRTPEKNIEELGFTPDIYSPYHPFVDENLVEFCHSRSMKVVPWTVNDLREMRKLMKLGVDGLISDYPDLYSELP